MVSPDGLVCSGPNRGPLTRAQPVDHERGLGAAPDARTGACGRIYGMHSAHIWATMALDQSPPSGAK